MNQFSSEEEEKKNLKGRLYNAIGLMNVPELRKICNLLGVNTEPKIKKIKKDYFSF